jgi:spore germination protein GerM
MSRRLPARAIALVVASALLTACAISEETSPRDISEEQQGVFDVRASGDEAAGDSRIFLLTPGEEDGQQHLRAVSRDVANTPNDVLRSLFAGPNADEQEQLLDTALPDDLALNGARITADLLTIDVNDALRGLSQDGLRLAIAQIVSTASELPDVAEVAIRVDGETQSWPLGDGELTERPLTRFDYPGLVESTQPEFPPVPAASERA